MNELFVVIQVNKFFTVNIQATRKCK